MVERLLTGRYSDNATYFTYGSGGLVIRNNVSVPTMFVTTSGNVGIGISPTNKLHSAGAVSATAFVTTSDRNAKEDFTPVSPLEALNKLAALPITTWNFKSMNDDRHMGPIAQDFYAAFGLGGGDTTITGVAPDGVALGADRQEPYETPRRLNLGGEFRGPFDSALWAVFKFRQPSWQRPCPRSANCDNFGRFLMCAQRSQRAAQVFAFRS